MCHWECCVTNIHQILNDELTPEQRAAVIDTSTEIRCLACAGSG